MPSVIGHFFEKIKNTFFHIANGSLPNTPAIFVYYECRVTAQ